MPSTLPAHEDLVRETREILARLGVENLSDAGELIARSPITGGELARVPAHTVEDVAARSSAARRMPSSAWRTVPGPVRGQLVRELGELLREHKADLGALVSIEAGKIRSEGLGEVQEMIDICDLAVGLSRQLFGLTIASERPGHRMMEQWHPLGVVGVISAFNFPVAVWSWNAALAFVCGDSVVWKPSEKTLLTALACQSLVAEAARRVGRTREHLAPGARRRRGRRGTRRRRPRRAAVGHRFDAHGQGRRTARGCSLRQAAAGTRRQQRRDRHPERRSRSHRARHRVLCGRHGRPTLHLAASRDRAFVDRRRTGRADQVRLRDAADRVAAGRGHARRPAGRQGRLRGIRDARSRRRRQTAASSSPAASACSATRTPMPTTCSRRSSACRRRARSCAPRPSPRSST